MKQHFAPGNELAALLLSFLTVFGLVLPSAGQVPEYFTLQGLVTNPGGDPITGYHSITVRLYDGSAVVFSQTEAGTTTDGMFNMHVGPVDSVVFGKPLQFGISIDSDAEMPREDLESVPYALGLRGMRVQHPTTANRPPNIIGGEPRNTVAPDIWGATISGGGGYEGPGDYDPNIVEDDWGTIGGGLANLITPELAGSGATIGGGVGNTANGGGATIAGGITNEIIDREGAICGGYDNTAGYAAFVGGGRYNTASGNWSTVVGGAYNTASGSHSFASGKYASAAHEGSFVWQDASAISSGHVLSTYANNQFRVRASGGFLFQTAAAPNLSTGARLDSDEGAWEALSSRAAKKEFAPVNPTEILSKVAALDVSTWRYETQDKPVRHIGPVSEDFYAAFGFGSDDTHISTIDADGVALAAIKGLYEIVKEQQVEIEKLKRQVIDNRQSTIDN